MAFSFNGSSQYLTADLASNITAYPYTIVGYGLTTELSANGANVFSMFRKGTTFTGYSVVYFSSSPYATFVATQGDGSSSGAISSSNNYSTQTWYSLAGVFTSATSRSAFLDGQGKDTNSTNVNPAPQLEQIAIGARTNTSPISRYLNGKAAECAIWSAALTDAEIASLAKGFKPTRIRPQSLVFYAPLIRNLQDIKAGLALTNNNSATVADHPRVY